MLIKYDYYRYEAGAPSLPPDRRVEVWLLPKKHRHHEIISLWKEYAAVNKDSPSISIH